jgi:hypothetical protein
MRDSGSLILNCITVLILCACAEAQPQAALDWATSAERTRLQSQEKIENRIKVYELASERYRKEVMEYAGRQEFDALTQILASWTQLLEESHKDIDANIGRKKKSRALIRYEIQLRKSIGDMQQTKLKARADDLEEFESWVDRAEEIRKTFVNILFRA